MSRLAGYAAPMTAPVDPYQPPAAPLDGVRVAPASSGTVPQSVVLLLQQTRPWVKLMAILSFVVIGGMLVATAVAATKALDFIKVSALVPMLILLLFYVPPTLFLWRYAGGIRDLMKGGGQPALEAALRNQKSFWKYVGIFASVLLGLYALMFAMMGAGLFKR
jgi:hypothetical protein